MSIDKEWEEKWLVFKARHHEGRELTDGDRLMYGIGFLDGQYHEINKKNLEAIRDIGAAFDRGDKTMEKLDADTRKP